MRGSGGCDRRRSAAIDQITRQPISCGGDSSRPIDHQAIEGHAVDALRPVAQGRVAAIAHIGQNFGHRFSRSEIAPEDAAQTLLQRIGQRRLRLAAIENGRWASLRSVYSF